MKKSNLWFTYGHKWATLGAMQTSRAAQAIKDRMTELRLGPRDLKPLGGPSEYTVRKFLSEDISEGVQSRTLQSFDVALGWRRGSLREVLFSGGDPTPADDYFEGSRAVSAALDGGEGWAAVPKWMITDLAAMIAELSLLTRERVGQLPETVARASTLVADMLAVMAAGSRSPEDLARLAEMLSPDHSASL